MVETKKSLSLVMIEWTDSYSVGDSVWVKASELEGVPVPNPHYSVGWVLARSAEAITLVPHVGVYAGEVVSTCGNLTIPVCSISCITKIAAPRGLRLTK